MSGWGCPHEVRGLCSKLKGTSINTACDPGMKGCVLYGRFAFSDADKNSPSIKRKLKDAKKKEKNDGAK